MLIDYIRPSKPIWNAIIDQFNRTYCEDVLDMHLFRDLDEAREATGRGIPGYDEVRPHDASGPHFAQRVRGS